MDKWDRRFIRMAREVATWSKDPRAKVGALMVSPDRRRSSWGYNGLPAGIEDAPERLEDREVKNLLTVHAEMNALLNCPADPRGWTLYVTRFPCCSKGCAQGIIQRGVARLVTPPPPPGSSWERDLLTAWDLLCEAGVEVWIYLPEELDGEEQ